MSRNSAHSLQPMASADPSEKILGDNSRHNSIGRKTRSAFVAPFKQSWRNRIFRHSWNGGSKARVDNIIYFLVIAGWSDVVRKCIVFYIYVIIYVIYLIYVIPTAACEKSDLRSFLEGKQFHHDPKAKKLEFVRICRKSGPHILKMSPFHYSLDAIEYV